MVLKLLEGALALSQFSPVVSKWLGDGKNESVSHKILDIAKRVSGADNMGDAVSKIRENPELILEFQKSILEFDQKMEGLTVQDRESARTRDIAIVNSGQKNRRADIMVIAAVFGLLLCLVTITIFKDNLPGEVVGIISTVSGIFGSCLRDAYNFEFGSSRGSKDKDQTVAAFINKM